VSASVRGASAGRPASSAASDLALLRAAPSRPTNGTAQAGPVRQADAGSTEDASSGGAGDNQVGSGSNSTPGTARPTDTVSTTTPSRSAFGETLAASMSGSSTGPQSPTPARSTRTKSTDPKSQVPAGLLPALSLPAAAASETPASTPTSSGGATQAVSALASQPGATADTADSDEATASAATSAAAPNAESTAPAAEGLTLTAATFANFKPSAQPGAGKAQSDEPDQVTAPDSATSASAASSDGPVSAVAAPIVTAQPAALAQLTTALTHGQGGSGDAQSGASGGASADSAATATALGAAGTAAANSAPTAASPTPSAMGSVSVPIHAEVGSPAWTQELGVRLNWMAQAGISSASLHLTPEQLGPVEVRISVHQNTASVWFGAAQADTRSALEQALPKLKEMFASQGMNLAHTGVSDQSARGAQRDPQSPTPSQAAALRGLNATPVTSAPRVHQGLIDTYA
jgi:flagellar hook-length control protein FliK